MNGASDTAQRERLLRLAALPDELIDTTDLPVIEDWSAGMRGGKPCDIRVRTTSRSPAPTVRVRSDR